MVSYSDSSLASLLLVNRLVDVGAPPMKASEYWALLDQVGDPACLLGSSPEQVASLTGMLDGERLARLLDASTALAFELDRLNQSGINTVSPFDDLYPQRLRARLDSAAPVLLHVAGQADVLSGGGIGVVGSRNVGP